MKLLLLLLIIFSITKAFSGPQDELTNTKLNSYFGTEVNYESFFENLKTSILEGKKHKVAALNNYPLRVNYLDGGVYYNDENEFLENYDRIIGPQLLERLERQKFKSLNYNYNGLNVGYGEIWFTASCPVDTNCDNPTIKVWSYSSVFVDTSKHNKALNTCSASCHTGTQTQRCFAFYRCICAR